MSRRFGSRSPRASLFIRNVPYHIRRSQLEQAFSQYGDIRDVYIPLDYYTREPRGFAYVEFEEEKDASNALKEMDGQRVWGQIIHLEWAKSDRKTPQEMRHQTPSAAVPRNRTRSKRFNSRSRSPSYIYQSRRRPGYRSNHTSKNYRTIYVDRRGRRIHRSRSRYMGSVGRSYSRSYSYSPSPYGRRRTHKRRSFSGSIESGRYYGSSFSHSRSFSSRSYMNDSISRSPSHISTGVKAGVDDSKIVDEPTMTQLSNMPERGEIVNDTLPVKEVRKRRKHRKHRHHYHHRRYHRGRDRRMRRKRNHNRIKNVIGEEKGKIEILNAAMVNIPQTDLNVVQEPVLNTNIVSVPIPVSQVII